MKRRRRRKILNVPVAAMGDIAFLLIIFFLVASRIAQDKKIDAATSLDAYKIKPSPITVLIDGDGIIYVNGRRVESAKEVKADVKEMLDRRQATNEVQRTVMFKCDRAVAKNRFEPVIESIAEAGGIVGASGRQKEPGGR